MRRAGARLLLALPLVAGAAGWAQAPRFEPPGAVAQIAPASTPADDTRPRQIGVATRDVATGVAAAPADARSAPQLAKPGDRAAPPQLGERERTARGPAQLSAGPASAQPPAPLSRPAEGRTGAVARVEGRDRCDPVARASEGAARAAAPGRSKARLTKPAPATAPHAPMPGAACAAVIETRGSEFPPPVVEPLSPEQRLLVEQRQRQSRAPEPDSIARAASRRGGRDGADAEAPPMQGLASVVLAAPPAPAPQPTAGLSAEQAAIVTGVLGALQGGAR